MKLPPSAAPGRARGQSRRPVWRAALALLLTLALTGAAHAVVYVNQNATGPIEDGTSWDTAYHTLQTGVANAGPNGEVWVAAGVYNESIWLNYGVSLYGGFAGNETSRSQRDPVANSTSLHATDYSGLTATSMDVLVDGFTVESGGSGINLFNANATVLNCTLVNCQQGITAQSGAATIANCAFQGDGQTMNTYGVYLDQGYAAVSDCRFTGLSAGVKVWSNASADIATSTFTNSWAAIQIDSGPVSVDRCTVTGCNEGIGSNNAAVTVTRTWIDGGFDGIICSSGSVDASNCLILNTFNGVNVGGGVATLTNNTIVGSQNGGVWVHSPTTIKNCIIAFGSIGIGQRDGDNARMSHNDVYANSFSNYDSAFPDATDFSADPGFVNQSGGDYHLQIGSPCIDAGDDAASYGSEDFGGRMRRWGAHVDVGAYEGVPIFVDADAKGLPHDGSSWDNAYNTVLDALAAAKTGDSLVVARGTYTGNVSMKEGVALYGGFRSGDTSLAQRDAASNTTVLDGGGSGNVVDCMWPGAILEGFRIRNSAPSAAGVLIGASSATVADCIIDVSEGGYGFQVNPETLGTALSRCVIHGAPSSMGIDLRGTGSIMDSVISDNVIGIMTTTDGASTIANCNIIGGLVGAYLVSGQTDISNSIVTNAGTGIYVEGGTATLSHNNVWASEYGNYDGVSDPTGTNGNISVDPMYVDLAGGDYRLHRESSCVNAGEDSIVGSTTDVNGSPRLMGSHVDIGAAEYDYVLASVPGATLTSPTASPDGVLYFGDSNGVIHAVDTTTHLSYWDIDITAEHEAAPYNGDRKPLGRLTRWWLGGAPRIFCVTSDNYLMVFDLNGARVWTRALHGMGSSVTGSAMAMDGYVYVASSQTNMSTISKLAADGSDAGYVDLFNSSIASPVAVFGDSLFVSTSNLSYRLSTSDLTVLNFFSSGVAPPFVTSTAGNPMAITVRWDGFVEAYSATTGEMATNWGENGWGWVNLGINLASNPKVTAAPFVYGRRDGSGDKIYVGGLDNKVYCINLADGTPGAPGGGLVFRDLAAEFGPGAITTGIGICPLYGGTLVVGSTNGRYVATHLDGTNSLVNNVLSPISTAPAFDPMTGAVCFASDNGRMYQLPALP